MSTRLKDLESNFNRIVREVIFLLGELAGEFMVKREHGTFIKNSAKREAVMDHCNNEREKITRLRHLLFELDYNNNNLAIVEKLRNAIVARKLSADDLLDIMSSSVHDSIRSSALVRAGGASMLSSLCSNCNGSHLGKCRKTKCLICEKCHLGNCTQGVECDKCGKLCSSSAAHPCEYCSICETFTIRSNKMCPCNAKCDKYCSEPYQYFP